MILIMASWFLVAVRKRWRRGEYLLATARNREKKKKIDSSTTRRVMSTSKTQVALEIEYSALAQHSPGGVYVIPSLDDELIWFGVVFLRAGVYKNGIFNFRIDLHNYNEVNCWPGITFKNRVFHPMVGEESNDLDLKEYFPNWESKNTSLVTVLTYVKKIFYMKASEYGKEVLESPGNVRACELFNGGESERAEYIEEVNRCVELSQVEMFECEECSSLKFSEEEKAHGILKNLLVGDESEEGSSVLMKVAAVKEMISSFN